MASESRSIARHQVSLAQAAAAGSALGAVSLALDELSGPVGAMLRGIGGGAFAWGLAALLAGACTQAKRPCWRLT